MDGHEPEERKFLDRTIASPSGQRRNGQKSSSSRVHGKVTAIGFESSASTIAAATNR